MRQGAAVRAIIRSGEKKKWGEQGAGRVDFRKESGRGNGEGRPQK